MGSCANHWLDVLYNQGSDLEDDQLFSLIRSVLACFCLDLPLTRSPVELAGLPICAVCDWLACAQREQEHDGRAVRVRGSQVHCRESFSSFF